MKETLLYGPGASTAGSPVSDKERIEPHTLQHNPRVPQGPENLVWACTVFIGLDCRMGACHTTSVIQEHLRDGYTEAGPSAHFGQGS